MKKTVLHILALVICASVLPVQSGGNKEIKAKTDYGLSNPVFRNGVTTWDTIYFGNYWQNDRSLGGLGSVNESGKKEPIRWRVLSVDGYDAFLLADRGLDCQTYNDVYKKVSWELCTLRKWLNSTFLDTAFTKAEQDAVLKTVVVNDANSQYGISGGKNTVDKVYLLSAAEADNSKYGFYSSMSGEAETRCAKPTVYAKEKGAGVFYDAATGNCAWWLRSPNEDIIGALRISERGACFEGGTSVTNSLAIRPAIHINLSSTSLWKRGRKVSSDGTESADTGANVISKPKVNIGTVKRKKSGIYKEGAILAWNYNPAAQGYEVSRATVKKGPYKRVYSSTNPANVIFTDFNVKKGGTYYYRVRTHAKENGVNLYSDYAVVRVALSTKLMKPKVTMARKGKKAVFTFKKAEGTRYETQYRFTGSKKWKKLSVMKGKLKAKIVKKIKGKNFQLRIRTYEKTGKKKYCSKWSRKIKIQ